MDRKSNIVRIFFFIFDKTINLYGKLFHFKNVFLPPLLNCYFVVCNVSSNNLLTFICKYLWSCYFILSTLLECNSRTYTHTHIQTHIQTRLYKIWGPFFEVIRGMCLLYKILGWYANEHCLHNILCPVSYLPISHWQISSFWNKSVWFGITIYNLSILL